MSKIFIKRRNHKELEFDIQISRWRKYRKKKGVLKDSNRNGTLKKVKIKNIFE